MELINSVITESWAMERTSICSPLEGKEMRRGSVGRNSYTGYNLAEPPPNQMYLMVWMPQWKLGRGFTYILKRMQTRTDTINRPLRVCVRVDSATFDQLGFILNSHFNCSFSYPFVVSSLFSHITCCSTHSFDQGFRCCGDPTVRWF